MHLPSVLMLAMALQDGRRLTFVGSSAATGSGLCSTTGSCTVSEGELSTDFSSSTIGASADAELSSTTGGAVSSTCNWSAPFVRPHKS